MAVERPVSETADRRAAAGDSCSRRWVEQLQLDHPHYDEAVARLHDVLRRAALHELRRRSSLGPRLAGPELDDVIELRGEDPSERFPGTAIHLRVCSGCRADHDGVLEAARRFGDIGPDAE